jgi:hypothetical protein
MAMIHLPTEFNEFIQLLNGHGVEYLIVGGYAVGYYGYPRATGDMDVWIAVDPRNVGKVIEVLREFGLAITETSSGSFLTDGQFISIGHPPLRIEVLTEIDGVEFQECYQQRMIELIDGVAINFISLQHLKLNKLASGRYKDLNDLENLSE